MGEKKKRIVCILIPAFFLAVILGLYGLSCCRLTFHEYEPEKKFSLERGTYRVSLELPEPAERYCVRYEANGQERILAQGDLQYAYEDGSYAFEMTLPSNIRNDSISVSLEAQGKPLLQLPVLRIVKILPTLQTVLFLAVYLVLMGLLFKGFGGGTDACRLMGLVSMAFLPLYPVFCAAPGQTAGLAALGAALLFLADRRFHVPRQNSIRYVFFLALSLAALYFATESSPFYVRNPWDDASIYYAIGRGITQGYVPYRDMFDHKGSVVFFLYALGHLLTPDHFYGVYLLESLCFSGVLYFVYKTARLYFEEGAAEAVAVVSLVFLLDGSFLVYGGSCEEFTMVIYAAVLYGYLAYFSGKRECTPGGLAAAGALCGISFWMKFNMTVCLLVLVGTVLFRRLIGRQKLLKHLAAFVGGGIAVSIPVVGYFLCHSALGYLKAGYFDANLAYADVKTIGETLSLFGQNVLLAVSDNPGISLLIAAGVLGFLAVPGYIGDLWGKIGLAAAFAVLVGSTYISYAYLYYYCLPAMFAVLGIIVIAGAATGRGGGRIFMGRRARYLALPCLCILLVFNQNHREAAVFADNLSLYDVCELEIDQAGLEKTLLIYRNHWAQMMTFPGMKPAARYYFAPNVAKKIPEIDQQQDQYIHEGIANYVLVDHVDSYPSLAEWGLYQYEQILDWQEGSDSVQLYCRKK